MKRNEAAFLVSVLAFALVIACFSFFQFLELRATHGETSLALSAGKPRIVDVGKIRRQMRQGYLSEEEARFYRKSPGTADGQDASAYSPVPPEAEKGEEPLSTK